MLSWKIGRRIPVIKMLTSAEKGSNPNNVGPTLFGWGNRFFFSIGCTTIEASEDIPIELLNDFVYLEVSGSP